MYNSCPGVIVVVSGQLHWLSPNEAVRLQRIREHVVWCWTYPYREQLNKLTPQKRPRPVLVLHWLTHTHTHKREELRSTILGDVYTHTGVISVGKLSAACKACARINNQSSVELKILKKFQTTWALHIGIKKVGLEIIRDGDSGSYETNLSQSWDRLSHPTYSNQLPHFWIEPWNKKNTWFYL